MFVEKDSNKFWSGPSQECMKRQVAPASHAQKIHSSFVTRLICFMELVSSHISHHNTSVCVCVSWVFLYFLWFWWLYFFLLFYYIYSTSYILIIYIYIAFLGSKLMMIQTFNIDTSWIRRHSLPHDDWVVIFVPKSFLCFSFSTIF